MDENLDSDLRNKYIPDDGDSDRPHKYKVCPHCNELNLPDANYCVKCGGKLDEQAKWKLVNEQDSVVCSRSEYDAQKHVDKQIYDAQEHVDKQTYDAQEHVDKQIYDAQEHVDKQIYDAQEHVDKQIYDAQEHVDKQTYDRQRHVDKQTYDRQRHVDKQTYDRQRHVDKHKYDAQEHVNKNLYDHQIHLDTSRHPLIAKYSALRSDRQKFRKWLIVGCTCVVLCGAGILVGIFRPEPPADPPTRILTSPAEFPPLEGLYGITQYAYDKQVGTIRTAAVRMAGAQYEVGIVTEYGTENHTFQVVDNGGLMSSTMGKGWVETNPSNVGFKLIFESRENKWIFTKN